MTDEEIINEAITILVKSYPIEVLSRVPMHLALTEEYGNPEAPVNDDYAFAVAEAIGPDWTKALITFAQRAHAFAGGYTPGPKASRWTRVPEGYGS